MDMVAVLRAVGGLAIVLGLLAGAVWVSRRYKLTWPGLGHGATPRRLQLIERLALDQRRAVVLLRCGDREHLVLLSPQGQIVIESGIASTAETALQAIAPPNPSKAPVAAAESFAELINAACRRRAYV